MFNKDKTEKQLLYSEIERLKKASRKLADENRRLRENSVIMEQYRKEYMELMESAGIIQKRYKKQADDFARLGGMFRKELGRLKQQMGEMDEIHFNLNKIKL